VATQSDWDNLLADDYPATAFPLMRSILRSVRAFWKAKTGDGTAEPSDVLKYLNFGDSANALRWRIGYTAAASRCVVEENTGTEGAPTWVTRFTLAATTGALTLTGALTVAGAITGCNAMTMAGALNMGGFNITNIGSITVGLISGVDITAHMARHLPGGADALTNNVAPPAIGPASAAGAGGALANSSHTHEGLHQIDTDSSGATQVKGDANFISGAYMLVTKSGQNITFAFAKPGRVSGKTAADQSVTVEADLTSLTALALAPATVVNTRTYEISGQLEIVNGATAGANATLRFYNGAAGALADGAGKKILEHTLDLPTASDSYVIPFGPFPWTPANVADLKIGATLQFSAGTGTVKGTASRLSYLKCIEVFT
jgi:hypothetical protein